MDFLLLPLHDHFMIRKTLDIKVLFSGSCSHGDVFWQDPAIREEAVSLNANHTGLQSTPGPASSSELNHQADNFRGSHACFQISVNAQTVCYLVNIVLRSIECGVIDQN